MKACLPPEIAKRLADYGQGHLVDHLAQLDFPLSHAFAGELARLDPIQLSDLFHGLHLAQPPDLKHLEPPPIAPSVDDAAARTAGIQALRDGTVAVVLVAGGQGSRLGSDLPKGCFPVGPVSGATLYQIHAAKVLELGRRFGRTPPLLVMTSRATDEATRTFFASQQNFGLQANDVQFFRQAEMPALDRATGKVLLEAPGRLFTAPDGHGGCLTALSRQGWLDRLESGGIQHLFYFQVDNPLVRIADPVFLGRHLLAGSQASSKVIARRHAGEKLGVFASLGGRCHIVEYSDLPKEMDEATGSDGGILFNAGNPAIHVFSVPFLRKAASGDENMPFHAALKKVPNWTPRYGSQVPDRENAIKYEKFMFDILPHAAPWLLMWTSREDEFAPLKNADGADSPAGVRQAQSRLAVRWLEAAGVTVPKDSAGNPPVPLEIAPSAGLEPGDLDPGRLRCIDWSRPVLIQS